MHHLKNFPQQLTPVAIIGRSSLSDGAVICSHHATKNILMAVKCIDIDTCSTNLLALLQHEVCLSRTLIHPNLSTYSSVSLHGSVLCLAMPLMEYGSSTDIIAARFKYGLPEEVIALIAREVLKALVYLHGMHLIHRGIRGSHILVSKKGEVKLTGHRSIIALSQDGIPVSKVHDFPTHDSSLLPWLSPEILQQNMQGYCTKSDIYSLGITACELANGHAPFIDMPSTQMLLEKLNGTIPFLLDETTVPPLDGNGDEKESSTININHEVTRLSMIRTASGRRFSPVLHTFVGDCLEREPDRRPSAENLLKHPFFKQLKSHSNSDIMKSIFRKLEPISVDSKGEDVRWDAEISANKLESMDINDVEWDFSS